MTAFVAIDFETADAGRDSACAVGVARVEGAAVVYRDTALIRPPRSMAAVNTAVHGLTWAMVKDAPPFGEVWAKLLPVLDGAASLVAHNAPFDRSVLSACCKAAGLSAPVLPWTDTLALARKRWPSPQKNTLPDVCRRLGVPLAAHHEAGADAEACARVLIALEGRVTPAAPAEVRTSGPAAAAGVSARLRELGCTPDLIADAEAGRIDPADLLRWVEAWARERGRKPVRAGGAA